MYRGGPAGLEPTPSTVLTGTGGFLDNFGSSMAATYLDADPYPDLVIGEARNPLFGGGSTGRVHVFLGGPGGPYAVADLVLTGPSGSGFGFGLQVASAGDLNLDGHGDVLVSEPLASNAAGRAYLYLGTGGGIHPTPALKLMPPFGARAGYFSWALEGGGDADGDGFVDLAIGETDALGLRGRAHLYFGPFDVEPGSPWSPRLVWPHETVTGLHTDAGYFGSALALGDSDGDGDDELVVGAPNADGSGRVYVFEDGEDLIQTILSPLATGSFGATLSRLAASRPVARFVDGTDTRGRSAGSRHARAASRRIRLSGYIAPMSATVRHHLLTLDDYFAVERSSPRRHEFAEGQIFLMAGGSPRHNYLETRVLQALAKRLEGAPCFTMTSNQRIATGDGLYTYADGSVFCGAMEGGPEQTATNPVLLVEVLSDATRAYDRGEKLDRYKSIPSLRHVVFVEPDAVDVEVWTRGDAGWTRTVSVDRATLVRLDALGVDLPIAEIYDGIDRIPG